MTENVRPIPAYEAFLVDESGKTAHWTKVGAAWHHEDGKGVNLSITRTVGQRQAGAACRRPGAQI